MEREDPQAAPSPEHGVEVEVGAEAGLGLTQPRMLSLERFAIRTRTDSVTRSAWRLEIVCAEGPGAIVCVEAVPGETHYRGEGVFLGWSQARLERAYRELRSADAGPAFTLNQLG